MATRTRQPHVDADQAEANRISASLAGLAAALFFVVVGLVLVHRLDAEAHVEDCLMSGRTNCDQLLNQR